MKVYVLIFGLTILCVTQSGCKKDKMDIYSGGVNAVKNGVNWYPYIRGSAKDARADGQFFLYIDEFSGETMLNSLVIGNIPFSGRHRIFKSVSGAPPTFVKAHYSDTWDGHSLCTVYEVFEADSAANFIEITSYDSRKKYVKGKFGVKLYNAGSCTSGYPDTLVIKDATFETKID